MQWSGVEWSAIGKGRERERESVREVRLLYSRVGNTLTSCIIIIHHHHHHHHHPQGGQACHVTQPVTKRTAVTGITHKPHDKRQASCPSHMQCTRSRSIAGGLHPSYRALTMYVPLGGTCSTCDKINDW